MPDVISFANKIMELRNEPEKTFTYIIVVLLVIGVVIALLGIKLWYGRLIINRRNIWYIFSAIISAAVLLICFRKHWINGIWTWILTFLWLLYVIFTLCDVRSLSLQKKYRNTILRYYHHHLQKGMADSHISFFQKERPFLLHVLFSATDRIEYYYLKHSYCIAIDNYEEAYKALLSIKEDTLYDNEKTDINLRKAYCLTMMGSMTAAQELLGSYEENTSKDPMVWIAYSYIFEKGGNIDKAYEAAVKARDLADISNLSDLEKGKVYNDYGRAADSYGNDEEALRYLKIAWEKIKEKKDNRLILLIGSNYVLRLAFSGANRAECDQALEEFRKRIINPNALMNRLEYMNILLRYYSQFNDEKEIYQTIKKGFKGILPQLDQKEVFKASIFKLLMNGHFEHKWFDKNVEKDYDAYKNLELIDRLAAFIEYINIFDQEEFRVVLKNEPYKTLQKTILKYYREDAIKEIDEEIGRIESYNTSKYIKLVHHKLNVLKHIEGKQHIDKSKDIYLQLTSTLENAGLRIEAVNNLLLLMENCGSPDNILVKIPFNSEWLYYSDVMKSLPFVPDPILMPDGIHLNYFRRNLSPYEIKPLKDNIILEHLDKAIEEVKSWENHPAKIEFSIRISYFLMCFERSAEAKEMFDIYENSRVSDNFFSSSLKEVILLLRETLGTKKKV